MRRVVVTGLGMVSPFGRGVDFNWKNILDGKSGIRKIDNIDLKDIPCQIAGQVPFGKEEKQFDPDTVMAPKDQKKVDKFILYGLAGRRRCNRRFRLETGDRRRSVPFRRYDGFRHRRPADDL